MLHGEKMYLCEACDGVFSCSGCVTVTLENWLVTDSAEMWFIFILRENKPLKTSLNLKVKKMPPGGLSMRRNFSSEPPNL